MAFKLPYFIFPAFVVLAIPACGGGQMGTGTGPKEDINEFALLSLPRTLSPRIPESLLTDENLQRATGFRSNDNQNPAAQSWQDLAPPLSQHQLDSLAITEELALLDSVFPMLEQQCATQDEAVCQLPAGSLSANYTDALIQQLTQPIEDRGMPSSIEQSWIEHLELSAGTPIYFGDLTYSVRQDNDYPYQLTLSPLVRLPNHELQIEWIDGFTDISYSLKRLDGTQTSRFHYERESQNNVHILSSTTTSLEQETFAFEIVAGINEIDNVLIDAELNGKRYSGRANDQKASFRILDTFEGSEAEIELFVAEAFEQDGNITVSARCTADSIEPVCRAVAISLPEGVGEYFATSNIMISNLPTTVNSFEIVTNDPLLSLDEQQTLCIGWLDPDNLDATDLVCVGDYEAVLKGVVVIIDRFGNRQMLPDAKITELEF